MPQTSSDKGQDRCNFWTLSSHFWEEVRSSRKTELTHLDPAWSGLEAMRVLETPISRFRSRPPRLKITSSIDPSSSDPGAFFARSPCLHLPPRTLHYCRHCAVGSANRRTSDLKLVLLLLLPEEVESRCDSPKNEHIKTNTSSRPPFPFKDLAGTFKVVPFDCIVVAF